MKAIRRKALQLFKTTNPHDHDLQDTGTRDNVLDATAYKLSPNISSHNTPSNSIPKNILAFRTITTMLGQIQQEKVFKLEDVDQNLEDEERRELKIANAFSTVAVIDHQIIAVVTKRNVGNLEIIACMTQPPSNEDLSAKPKPSTFWQLLITQNPRRHTITNNIPEPFIQHVESPAGLLPGDAETLITYIEQCWSHPTLSQHLWILSQLLVMENVDAGTLSMRLLLYVIATCHPKILHRLRHETLSQPYIKSLQQTSVTHKQFSECAQVEKPSKDELVNNEQFMITYVLHVASAIPDFCQEYPNIIKEAKCACEKQPFQLYNNETCVEFHKIFIFLLQNFQDSLHNLEKLRGSSKRPVQGTPEFDDMLFIVFLNGYALQKLAKGFALRMHLTVIAPSLVKHRPSPTATAKPKPDDEPEEHDEDLEAVQPSVLIGDADVKMPLWKSYVDWLRLMVAHFDAVDILVGYVTGPLFQHKAISIQMLVAPTVNSDLLPWADLFVDSKLFPTRTVWPATFSRTYTDLPNKKLLETLNVASSLASKIKSIRTHWSNNNVWKTRKEVNALKTSTLKAWADFAIKLDTTLEDYENAVKTSELAELLSKQIDEDIESLFKSATFFSYLTTKGGEGDWQGNFKGTLHCEACLASLLDETITNTMRNKYGDILAQMEGFGHVIGVSKRCCPICRHLLSLLTRANGNGQKFITRGSHSTVSACTLPTWLPADIVDSMNVFFGGELRRELIELTQRPEVFWHRTRSTGSQRLSSDSSEDSARNISMPISVDLIKAVKYGQKLLK